MNRFFATLATYLPIFRRKPPKIRIGRTIVGYGRVNCWATTPLRDLRRDLVECATNGLGAYHIEYAGWGKANFWTDPKASDRVRERYRWLHRRCKALGIWLFVSLVNDNMGRGKYGDAGPTLRAVYDRAVEELEFIRRDGMRNVLVQPVAETQTETGRTFEAEAVARLQGWPLVYNGHSGHPSRPERGMTLYATHPGSIAEAKRCARDAIVSTDHGGIIRELGNGGLDTPANPDKLRDLAAAVRARGNPLFIYYAFLRERHDRAAIRALKP